MLELIKDVIEADGLGLDDVPPLFRGERQLARLVEEVLIHGLPGVTSPVPSAEGLINFEENRVLILDDAALEFWLMPWNEISSDKFAEELPLASITSFLLFESLIGVSSASDSRNSGERILFNRGTPCSVDGVLLHVWVSRLCSDSN